MLRAIDLYYAGQDERTRSCLQFLRKHILSVDDRIQEAWKYSMPFFTVNGRMFCYLWFDKKREQPCIGFVDGKFMDHKDLPQEKRSRMKIFLLGTKKDLPMKRIDALLKEAIILKLGA